MFKRLVLIVMLLIVVSTSPVVAAEKVSVALLPFEIHAQKDLDYLRLKIPEVIRDQLQNEGAQVAIHKDYAGPRDIQSLRQLGVKQGVDQVVWGSLTLISDHYSLDVKTLQSFTSASPEAFFVEGAGIETLLDKVAKLSQEMTIKLFKRRKVVEIRIDGNKRIEADAIKSKISTKPGDVFLAGNLSKDLKAVYDMGYFDDIRIESEADAQGQQIITFKVKEKPTIRHISLKGNHAIEDKDILEAMSLKRGAILNIFHLRNEVQRIEGLYKDKNYQNVKVEYSLKEVDNNQADVAFNITEGKKVRIKTISFVGNHAFTAKQLKKVMKTDEKGFFSFLTASGELDRAELEHDRNRIALHYLTNGYSDVKVGDPQLKFEGQWIYITINIEEGHQYRVASVRVEGDLIAPAATLEEKIKLTKGEVFNRKTVHDDILALSDFYADAGYANARVVPRTQKDDTNFTVDIVYTVEKEKLVYFERINIRGNTKTRDKVIRREFNIKEQDLYNRTEVQKGVRKLYRLEFFEDVKVDTVKGSADDKVVLNVDVKEKSTGSLSFGFGYSDANSGFLMADVVQRNLFGRGQLLRLAGQLGVVGSSNNEATVSFTEPWLFDIPLSAGFDVYHRKTEYDYYERLSTGGGLRFSYPIYEYTRLYWGYSYDISDIRDIDTSAASTIKALAGTNSTSKVTTKIRYDSRDRLFNATKGAEHSFTVEYAGLGGDVAFTKFEAKASYYHPLFWSTVGFVNLTGGYVVENGGGILPDYERFYLGGMNSVRGFPYRGIFARDASGNAIGGNKFIQFNLEYLFPISKPQNVMGVLFFDTGNVFAENDDFDLGTLRKSVGCGIRWFSPVGPIRVEYGYIIDAGTNTESGGRLDFSFGVAF